MGEQKVIIKQIDAIDSSDDFSAEKTYRVTVKKESSAGIAYSYDGFDPEPLFWLMGIVVFIITAFVSHSFLAAIFLTPFIMIPLGYFALIVWVVGMIFYGIVLTLWNGCQGLITYQKQKKAQQEKNQKEQLQRYLQGRAKYYANIASAEKLKAMQEKVDPLVISTVAQELSCVQLSTRLNSFSTVFATPKKDRNEFWATLLLLYGVVNLIGWTRYFGSSVDGVFVTIGFIVITLLALMTLAFMYLAISKSVFFICRYTSVCLKRR